MGTTLKKPPMTAAQRQAKYRSTRKMLWVAKDGKHTYASGLALGLEQGNAAGYKKGYDFAMELITALEDRLDAAINRFAALETLPARVTAVEARLDAGATGNTGGNGGTGNTGGNGGTGSTGAATKPNNPTPTQQGANGWTYQQWYDYGFGMADYYTKTLDYSGSVIAARVYVQISPENAGTAGFEVGVSARLDNWDGVQGH